MLQSWPSFACGGSQLNDEDILDRSFLPAKAKLDVVSPSPRISPTPLFSSFPFDDFDISLSTSALCGYGGDQGSYAFILIGTMETMLHREISQAS
jgi:hypothetical protein